MIAKRLTSFKIENKCPSCDTTLIDKFNKDGWIIVKCRICESVYFQKEGDLNDR